MASDDSDDPARRRDADAGDARVSQIARLNSHWRPRWRLLVDRESRRVGPVDAEPLDDVCELLRRTDRSRAGRSCAYEAEWNFLACARRKHRLRRGRQLRRAAAV